MKKIAIIGGGIGGLAVSIRMAARGFDVSLFESSQHLGGKIGQIKERGYRFDTGPSLLTQPYHIEELIRLCKKHPNDYFEYQKLKESCRYFFEDKTCIRGYSNAHRFSKEIAEKTNVDYQKVKKHLKKSSFLYNSTRRLFLEKSLHKVKTYFTFTSFISICKLPFLNLFTSMSKRNNKYFKNSKVEQIFNRYATYNGSDPFKAPAILNLIPHLEINQGSYFPKRGMISIATLLERLCVEMGVKIHTSSQVKKIDVNKKKVRGVHTKNKFYKADIVICNLDVYFAYDRLLNIKTKARKIKQIDRSTSAIIFYWGIKKTFDQLNLHNIFFSKNYKNEFNDISNKKIVPNDPTVYINITCKKNEDDAPKNCENWFVMINTPPNKGQDWESIIAKARKDIILKLERMLETSIAKHIVFEKVLEPTTIETKTASYQGSLYGTSSNNRKSAFFRHPNFSKNIDGLYFCGGSVHPGGGIPLALSSAKIVDQLIT